MSFMLKICFVIIVIFKRNSEKKLMDIISFTITCSIITSYTFYYNIIINGSKNLSNLIFNNNKKKLLTAYICRC